MEMVAISTLPARFRRAEDSGVDRSELMAGPFARLSAHCRVPVFPVGDEPPAEQMQPPHQHSTETEWDLS
jgi:hypothetical protein